MPISITGLDGPGRPEPAVAPLVELGSALHVLGNFCGPLSAGRHAVDLIAADLAQAFAR